MKRLVLSAAMLVAACGGAFAQTIGMGGTLNPSYNLTISAATGGPTNSGTATAATIGLGSIAFYGNSSNSSGVTQGTTGTTSGSSIGAGGTINLSFPVNIEVDEANSSSASYTLKAKLSSGAVTGTTVLMNSTTLTATAATVQSSVSYGSANAYTIYLNVATTVVDSDGGLGQTIDISFVPA